MKILVIDPRQNGISGDLLLASLTDLFQAHDFVNGLIAEILEKFPFVKANYRVTRKKDTSFKGSQLEQKITTDLAKGSVKEFLGEIERLFSALEVSSNARNKIKDIFSLIIEAEAFVHGKDPNRPETMHFHELNSIDTIIDIFTCVITIDKFYGLTNPIIGLPVSNGSGFVTFSHGTVALPAPAVSRILVQTQYENFHIDIPHELTTVTGIALLTQLTTNVFSFLPLHKKLAVGIGLGHLKLKERPNFLRTELIELSDDLLTQTKELKGGAKHGFVSHDDISVLETHLDDVSGEIIGNMFEELFKVDGVLDVSLYPLIMKKNRPGHCFRVIAKKQYEQPIIKEIIKSTGTLGVRIIPVKRHSILREIKVQKINLMGKEFSVHVKISKLGETYINIKPEFDDIRKIANQLNLPAKQVFEMVNNQVEKIFGVKHNER